MSSLSESARLRRRQDAIRRRRRRRQTAAALVGLVAFVVVVVAVAGGSGRKHPVPAASKHAKPIPAVESGLLPWHLPAPISREVILPGPGAKLLILGGL